MSETLAGQIGSVAKGIWWLVLVRGILGIVFGIIALIAPGAALTGIAIVVGVYLLMDGITEIIHAVQARKSDRRWGWLLFQGIVSVLAGLAAVILPGLAGLVGGLVVLWTVVVYTLLHGIMGIASAAGIREGSGRVWGIIAGVVSIVFAILLAIFVLLNPGATVLSLIWVVGIYAIIFGIVLIVASVKVRKHVRDL
jgi:uncharacterized membrane protein HdeD (DUF308 family)